MTRPPRSICLYCGSRSGRDPAYAEAARALGRAIGTRGWGLVYGAGDVGLMGTAAGAAQEAGARVTGFIPHHLEVMEVGKRDIHAMVVTETMHERKKLMYVNADAIVALPGGAGTLDELIEVLTWRQLGLHEKPVVLLDINGFWTPFTDLIAHMQREGFIGDSFSGYYRLCPTVEEAMTALE